MERKRYCPDTLGAIAGVVFAVLFFISTAFFDPLSEATDAELTAWWTDSDNLRANLISMYLRLACVPFFLLFLVALRGRLARVEDEDRSLSGFVFASGLCFAAAVLMGGVARGFIAQSVELADEPLPDVDTLRYVTAFSTVILQIVIMPAAAVMIAAASWLIVRSRAMATWVGWSGLAAAAVIAVATPLLVAQFALPLLFLWVAATSFELWRTRDALMHDRRKIHMAEAAGALPL